MRSLDSARLSWQALQKFKTLSDLKDAVRIQDGRPTGLPSGLRSVCWKTFLLFGTIDTAAWPRMLSSSRSAYNALRTHFLSHIEHPDELGAANDPLSEDNESLWATLRKDEELRQEIQQDVDRCMPEILYFRQPATQAMLLDILFIFCKLNPDVSYRQGMHEILAPILWVVEREAVELGESSKTMGEDAMIKSMFDAEHIEHDTFTLFGQVMQSAKGFYEQTTHTATENPIVVRSKRIFSELLPQCDAELAKYLENIDVVPQVFLMRWIRLLFGREFPFDDLLPIWDVVFAEDPVLEIVDYICIAMLLRIRWELLDGDYNTALTLLLRYPEPPEEHPPQTFVLDALYLRDHMHNDGGGYLVLKYTGRPMPLYNRPSTPPALQRNITTFSGSLPRPSGLSPPRFPRQASNIEAILQSTAKNIYTRGERLGINKAVRSAVDEVHKKAKEIREQQTPSSPPPTWRQRGSRSGVFNRVKELEERNRQLAKLLEGAVGELWAHQKEVADADKPASENTERQSVEVERLSVAIAKVQFVQVYLADPSIPLPADETESSNEKHSITDPLSEHQQEAPALSSPPISDEKAVPPTPPTPQVPVSESETPALADPATFDDSPQPSPALAPLIVEAAPSSMSRRQPSPEDKFTPHESRPTLAQSSFSWMLGQDQKPMSFVNTMPEPSEKRRSRGFLFGDGVEHDNDATIVSGKRKGKERKGSKSKGKAEPVVEDEVIDLGTVRRKQAANG